MRINVLAAFLAPDYYEIFGDVITAVVGETSEVYDLSGMPEGATLNPVAPLGEVIPIRSAVREGGELKVVLAQRVGAGHWHESGWMDAADYDPDEVHVTFDGTQAYQGRAVAYTRAGTHYPEGTQWLR